MPTWPGSLPTTFPLGTKEEANQNTVASDMDAGVRKMRPRYTALVRFLEPPGERFIFTESQKEALFTFHDTTCGFGSLEFDWVSTGPTPEFDGVTTAQKFRFDGRPTAQVIRPGSASTRLWSVAMRLEVLPV
ncbi:MAG: hypothetical protein CL793_07790 [Chloroflexi bacterium]|nr:hypothetical protein [Chloroflexota bacterium]|tara:strand:+ start:6718 stop:7113 length:396 start_codon:yes stop_codon:yes gene_type:complete